MKHLVVILLGCLVVLLMAGGPVSAQSTNLASPACFISLYPPNYDLSLGKRAAPDLNAEGITERGADFYIWGCFPFGSHTTITVSFNAVMSAPTTFDITSRGTYWDMEDDPPYGSLTVGAVTVQQGTADSGTVTLIEFDLENGSNNPAAYLKLENLRFDVTGTTGLKYSMVADGNPLVAFVGNSIPLGLVTGPYTLGNVKKTVASAGVTDVGWGFEDGVCPFQFGCGYPNKGATKGSLIDQAWWYMTTNPLWVTDFPFRRVVEPPPNSADPVTSLGPTDLVINVENIMAGVTVTLPDKLIVCSDYRADAFGHIPKLVEWDWYGGAKTATGGNLIGIYQTVYRDHVTSATLKVGTTDGAADNGCDKNSLYPLISVKIGNPSGDSADGTMQAYLRVVMGPATSAAFFGDDAQSTVIPRYLNSISASNLPTRSIIGDVGDPSDMTVPYFFLNPTQTVLLYPYVTNLMGWNTGIQVGNTGNDGAVFGNTGQTGALDFYFFPSAASSASGTPFVCSTVKSAAIPTLCVTGRGLDANGNLPAGSDFAALITDLLAAAGYAGNFDGYLIVVAHFNFAHGNGMLFGSDGHAGNVPALILGGRCSYNKNTAPSNPVTGAPAFPACSSARQGDLTKLPERLVM